MSRVARSPADAELAAKYQLLIEASNDALLFVDRSGMILDANHAAEQILGHSRTELLAKNIRDLLPPAAGTRPREQERHDQIGGGRFDAVHRLGGGSGRTVEVSSLTAVGVEEPVRLVLVRDMTERKTLEQRISFTRALDLILQSDTLDEGLKLLCDRLSSDLDLPGVWVGVKAPDGSVRVKAGAGRGTPGPDSPRIRWDAGGSDSEPTGEAIRTARTVRTRVQVGSDQQELLAVPIKHRGDVLGVISLYSSRTEQLDDPETVNLVERLARLLGLALAEEQEREALQAHRVALDASPTAVMIVDRSGRIAWVNEAFARLTGYSVDEAVGHKPCLLKSGLTPDATYAALWSTITAGATWTGELLNRRKDGRIYVDRQTINPVRAASGEVVYFVETKAGGAEQRQTEEPLRYLASHDLLTGLLNRCGFVERIRREVLGDGTAATNALLMLNVDNIEAIKAALGHAGADAALAAVANVIRQTVRPRDLAARYDGDRFAILLRDVSVDDAVRLGGSLQLAVQRSGIVDQGIALSASIGVVMVSKATPTDEILFLADEALARSRALGKNQVFVYHPESEDERQARSRWRTRIRRAVAQNDLVLHYQPVVRLEDGGVEFWEALLRMKNSKGDLLLPGEFLPHAFRYGLTPDLDLWVVDSVLRGIAENQGLRVAVNLSVQTLQDAQALTAIERLAKARRPGPGQLLFEISETAAIRDLDRINDWIQRMKQRGCRFALDDFGTGASSLAHLRSLAVDMVKMDGSYVRQLLDDPSCLTFVEAIHAMCQSMKIDLVAECVESPEVARRLLQVGVRLGQGYLWGRPAPMDHPVA